MRLDALRNLRAAGLHRSSAAVTGYRLARSGADRVGVQFVVKSFYSPIPDLRRLPPDVWTRESTLAGLDLQVDAALERLQRILPAYAAELRAAIAGGEVELPNESYSHGDAQVLHALVRDLRPTRVLELGSGQSTRVLALACRAARAEGHETEYVVADPWPTLDVAAIEGVSRFERRSAETLAASEFEALGDGDVLFVDTTHVVKLGSDVNRIVLDLLPMLHPGVHVHIHDVFLPYEYPREWAELYGLYWTEQYLLQAYLAENPHWSVVCPLHAIARQRPDELAALLPDAPRPLGPGAFWIRREQPASRVDAP